MMTPAAFKTGCETAHEVMCASAELRSALGLAPFDAAANPNLALPTNHQFSQQVVRRAGSAHSR
jgi:hypothetical protein